MKQDLDISNIESKPTVVLVSNQGEFDPIKLDVKPQIIEEGKFYYFGKSRKKYKCIKANSHLRGTYSTFIDSRGYKGIFPNEDIYLDKWKAPKRDRIRIERKKYDQMLFDLKMAQTALDNRNKEIDGWVKQNNELRAELDRLKVENENLFQENSILKNDLHMTKESCRKTNSDKIELEMDLKEARKSIVNWEDRVIAVSDKLSTIRDQRDMAVYVAVVATICALVLSLAVWFGALIPKI